MLPATANPTPRPLSSEGGEKGLAEGRVRQLDCRGAGAGNEHAQSERWKVDVDVCACFCACSFIKTQHTNLAISLSLALANHLVGVTDYGR